jgi:hypothetical protein
VAAFSTQRLCLRREAGECSNAFSTCRVRASTPSPSGSARSSRVFCATPATRAPAVKTEIAQVADQSPISCRPGPFGSVSPFLPPGRPVPICASVGSHPSAQCGRRGSQTAPPHRWPAPEWPIAFSNGERRPARAPLRGIPHDRVKCREDTLLAQSFVGATPASSRFSATLAMRETSMSNSTLRLRF